MTLGPCSHLVRSMKLTQNHIESFVRHVILGLEKKKLLTFNKPKETILKRAGQIIKTNFEEELQLERDVMKMLDNIEKQQTNQFERHRMFKILKKKIADERGFVL